MSTKPKACPCFSGRKYVECCKPLHDGGVAPSPDALMRSRYSAFALGLGDYLVRTLASEHEDRAHDPKALAIALSRAKDTQRFMGLEILEASEHGNAGVVKFRARIFERGTDKSFTERSEFVRENGEWRYLRGDTG